MSEQQSQKRGVRSEAQKTTTARNAYEPIPPASPVGGAFGEPKEHQSDEDLAYKIEEKRKRRNHASDETE